MKIFYFCALLCVSTLLFSCEKNVPVPNYWGLPGKWAYNSTNCNCTVNVESVTTTTIPVHPDVITFTPKSYQRFLGGQLQTQGTYTIVTDTVQSTHQAATRIIYDGDTTSPKTFFRMSGNTLVFFGDASVSNGGIETSYISQ